MRLYLFILIFFTVEEEGLEVKVFFYPALDMCKEERGKGGLVFFRKRFLEFLSGYITKWGPLCISAI